MARAGMMNAAPCPVVHVLTTAIRQFVESLSKCKTNQFRPRFSGRQPRGIVSIHGHHGEIHDLIGMCGCATPGNPSFPESFTSQWPQGHVDDVDEKMGAHYGIDSGISRLSIHAAIPL